jgi:hypothetical protein
MDALIHHPSSMTVFVHLFIRSVIQKFSIVTLNIIFSVAPWYGIKDSRKNKASLVTSVHILVNFSPVAGYFHQARFPTFIPVYITVYMYDEGVNISYYFLRFVAISLCRITSGVSL